MVGPGGFGICCTNVGVDGCWVTVVVRVGVDVVDCVTPTCDIDGIAGVAKAGKGSGATVSGAAADSSGIVGAVLLGRDDRLGAAASTKKLSGVKLVKKMPMHILFT